jgi:hypothetical protein
LVTVSVNVSVWPTVSLPKLRLVGLAPSAPAATPVPARGTDSEPVEPVIVKEPLALPVADGSNDTLKEVVLPAASVTGVVIPLKLKPVPVIPTCEIVRLEPPVLLTVSVSDSLCPTVSLAKLRLPGFEPSAPEATPVPLSGTDSDPFEASELMVKEPLAAPLVCGSNVTFNVVLWEGLTVTGTAIPLSWKPGPVTAAWLMLTATPPVLLMVNTWLC